MTEHPNPDRVALNRLADALVDDILNASDDEILAEFDEDPGGIERYVAEMRARVEQTIARLELGRRCRVTELSDTLDLKRDAAWYRHYYAPGSPIGDARAELLRVTRAVVHGDATVADLRTALADFDAAEKAHRGTRP